MGWEHLVVSQNGQLSMAAHPCRKLGLRCLSYVCELVVLAVFLVEGPVGLQSPLRHLDFWKAPDRKEKLNRLAY